MVTADEQYIRSRIPHRPPFLWLDRVEAITEEGIQATKRIPEDLDILQGHYPDYPIMPGVLLCEAVFQAGAVYISEMQHSHQTAGDPPVGSEGVPVLTRILGARFKREVKPGDNIEIQARLTEKLAGAWFMKGSVKLGGKVAVQVEFACALKGE